MATAVQPRLMTTEEFLALPDDGIRRELIRGVLWENPVSYRNPKHRSHVSRHEDPDFQLEPRGEIIAGDVGFRIRRNPDTIVGIDVATSRLREQPGERAGLSRVCRFLLSRSLSPSNTWETVTEKIQDYLDCAVSLVWILDPVFRTVTVYQPGDCLLVPRPRRVDRRAAPARLPCRSRPAIWRIRMRLTTPVAAFILTKSPSIRPIPCTIPSSSSATVGLAAMKCRILVLTSIALMSLAGRVSAQEPAYVDDLRFVHELRQRGDTDLAIDLLNRLAAGGSNELRKVLPYELALCSKAEAVNEPDSSKRLQLYAKARADLVKFRDSNPNDERLAEIKIDIAEITVLEGKTEISRAMARDGIEAQSAGLLEARTKFEAAAGELKSINDELEAKLAPLADPKTPAERTLRAKLAKTHLRAELSVALNLFDVGQTYHRDGNDAVLRERAGKMGAAVKALDKVAANEDTYSEVWQARAWLGRCKQELGEPKKAREQFIPIIAARSAAAADGKRLARYFRLLVIEEQLKSGAAEKDESVDTLIDGGRRWITDYPRALSTPEGNGVRFLLADALLQAAGGEKVVAAKKKEYREEARKLTSALAETENEYTDRARRMKIILIRQEGGFSKAVSDLKTFDECFVRAQYEIMMMGEDAQKIKDPKERETKQKEHVKTLLAALERAITMPGKSGNDVNNARAMLTFYNLTSGKFNDAIRIGRKFAEESRSGPAALAAAYDLQAYGASVDREQRGRAQERARRRVHRRPGEQYRRGDLPQTSGGATSRNAHVLRLLREDLAEGVGWQPGPASARRHESA